MKPSETATNRPSIALYGGSFDPVHCAHLLVARNALDQLGLNQVIFIPAAQSPFKERGTIASDAARVEMLRLATANEPSFAVDTSEIERGGVSYTVDTVTHFRQNHPTAQLYWIIGADQFELLHHWHQIQEIALALKFIVLRRPGHSIAKSSVTGLKYVEVMAPLMPHSSSQIRVLLGAGHSTEDLLPASVEAFISAHDLYTL